MAYLTLRRIDGSTEKRDLSKSQSLTIGRQAFNDICVPESEVHSLHCRIGWNKTRYELTSATSSGVEVNSTTVVQADLKPHDVIRVGSLDLIFEEDSNSESDESEPTRHHKSRSKSRRSTKAVEEEEVYEGPVLTESNALLGAVFSEEEEDTSREEVVETKLKRVERPTPKTDRPGGRQRRPGEEEVLRSPLVMGLTGGGLVLLLLTGIFWLLLGREKANRMYETAVSETNSGQFSQSVASFERFIQQYPNHSMRKQANRGLSKALVLKEITGASPAWKRGLDRLNEMIKAHRNDQDFSELHSTLFQYADQISLGAAKAAETSRDPELLVVSKEAQDLLERYADPTNPPVGPVGRINEQRVKADRAIDKQRTFDQSMKTIDEAIANKKPMIALSERLRLVRAIPDFLNSKRVRDALQKSLDLEKSVVAVDDTERVAETTDGPRPPNGSILGILHSRSRTDESSQGQLVFVVAKDSCYAVDATTGELVWRRVIGLNSPFFPVVHAGAQSTLLMFDTRHEELVACEVASGKLLWRQPLNARAIGKPLVHEGQIYLPIEGNSLVRIDADTGKLSAMVRFSQNLATTPALSRDGNYLLVPGEMAMIYSLSLRATSTQQTLAAAATTFTDHAAGAVSAPPLSMGNLLLICDNDQAESAQLRLWDATNPAVSLPELPATRIKGQVRDIPVLRGNQLVVPLAGEQFAAFAVSDEAGNTGIAPIGGEYSADKVGANALNKAPVFVAIGSDGQFWSASTAFRRFEIESDRLRMDSNSSAPGIASQPLQLLGDFFYVGRKTRYSDAVTFSPVERDKLINPWRCVVGDAPLEILPTRDGGIVWVGESGSLYSLSKNRLATGGIDLKSGNDLELPANISQPIRATLLQDQRLAVAVAGDTKVLLIINAAGQTVGKHPLSEMVETDPVLLDDGLVLPLPGKLKLLPLVSGKKNAQDWTAPVGDTRVPRWTSLVRIDGKELISCDDSGRLARIQFRQGDVPHLAEVAKFQLEQSVDLPPVLGGEFLYVADASGTCRQLNVHSFDADGQRTLTAPIKGIWSVGANVLVHAGDEKLWCLSNGKELPEKWSFDIGKVDTTGPALVSGDAVWLTRRDGTVLVLNRETGAEVRRIQLPQALGLGLRKINDTLVAIAVDGTIYRLE